MKKKVLKTVLLLCVLSLLIAPSVSAGVKKAIIVAGGGNDVSNPLWDATKLCADYAYGALIVQGYHRDNIFYISPESKYTPDGDASFANLKYAINTWASGASELVLYIVDHGGPGSFRLNKNETISAYTLNAYLDIFQIWTGGGDVIFIYDACESGSFIPYILSPSGKKRITLTSSSSSRNAFFLKDGRLSFSYMFWSVIYEGKPLNNAFSFASEMMQDYQTPLVDANGDGVAGDEIKQLGGIVLGNGTIIY